MRFPPRDATELWELYVKYDGVRGYKFLFGPDTLAECVRVMTEGPPEPIYNFRRAANEQAQPGSPQVSLPVREPVQHGNGG